MFTLRHATEDDIPRVIELGKEFGNQMLYQKDPELMTKYKDRILIAEEYTKSNKLPSGLTLAIRMNVPTVVGFYHYIVNSDPGFDEMLGCYSQFQEDIIGDTWDYKDGDLCICMQGGSSREALTEFVEYLQSKYPNVWCYCSIKSEILDTYEELGFIFKGADKFTFFNVNKGGNSTYRLGKWSSNPKIEETLVEETDDEEEIEYSD